MGGCSAPNCSNSTSIGKQLFRFPKDPVRKKKWVVNCRRDFEPTPHSRLCQGHFEQSQFEEIARSPAGGKKLKPNAIPTLFSVGDPPYPAVTTPYILLPLKPDPVEKELNLGTMAMPDAPLSLGWRRMMQTGQARTSSPAHSVNSSRNSWSRRCSTLQGYRRRQRR